MEGSMLQLTAHATDHLRAASARREGRHRTPKLVPKSGAIKLGYTDSPEPGDAIVDGHGVRLIVAKDIAGKLDEAVLDAQERDGKSVLVLRRQNGLGWEDS
jgi:hypothetical protein